MVASPKIPPGEHVPTADQRVIMHGVPWTQYEVMLALRGEKSVPRMAYLGGVLELMSPSRDHERINSFIGCLVEVYALEHGIEFTPYGQWTLRNAPKEAGLEPDECYIVGEQSKDRPDLAIEVIWTSGSIDKLEIYRRLRIPEVWFWKEERIEIDVLAADEYAACEHSHLFPDLDLSLLISFLDRPSASRAILEYRAALALAK
jgi:Uma2 family endonuclease